MMRTKYTALSTRKSRAVSNLKTDIDDFLIEVLTTYRINIAFFAVKTISKQGNEVGMVVDEYGNFIGLVTLEDLIEQIIGRLNQDEEELGILLNEDLSITADGQLVSEN